jgi:hypothetical protein
MRRDVTWTRLTATATSGSSTLTLASAVDWRVGEEIVVSATEFNSSQAETRIIAGVSADRRTLTLTTPLTHTHMGVSLTIPEWGARVSDAACCFVPASRSHASQRATRSHR